MCEVSIIVWSRYYFETVLKNFEKWRHKAAFHNFHQAF